MLSEYGAKKCLGCSEEMNLKEDSSVHFVVLNTGATYKPFTPFVECPNCGKLLKVGLRRCPDCYEEVTEEYAFSSAAAVVISTIACDLANSIRSFDAFAVLAVIGSVLIYVFERYTRDSPRLSYLILIWPITPLLATVLWSYRFGRFSFGDDEFLSSRRRMIRTLTLWLAILAAQLIPSATHGFIAESAHS